jgi:hypothetical protein
MLPFLLGHARRLGLDQTPDDVPGHAFIGVWVGALTLLVATLVVGDTTGTVVSLLAAYGAVAAFAWSHRLPSLLWSVVGQAIAVGVVLAGVLSDQAQPMDMVFGLLVVLAMVSATLRLLVGRTGRHG